MSAIRSTDTKPEIAVRSALHRLGYRFRKEYKVRAAGRKRSVDIAFPTEGLAVFIDGCFWHRCPEHGTVPKSNRDYWAPKLKRNVERDELVTESLKLDGWRVLRIWEHTAPPDAAALIADTVERLRSRELLRAAVWHRTAIDLYAGAGGSSEGLRRAGYDVLGAIECDGDCAASYRSNHPRTRLIEDDIRSVDPAGLKKTLGLRRGELSLLNACPPCQGFSSLGATDADDERNNLVADVQRFVEDLRPQAFVLENVRGLERDDRLATLVEATRAAGYAVRRYRVNATEFGVPQNRRRLIVIGALDVGEEQLPAHPVELLPRTFRRAPEPIEDALERAGPLEGTQDPVHRARASTPAVAARIRRIPVNGGRFDLPEEHQLECHKSLASKRSAAAAYGRMRLGEPAPTLTTRCTTPACGRFLHPTEDRGISLREAALLQTFPRRYRFEGSHQSIEAQIGNAVPVRMAEGLGLAVRELLLDAGR